MTSAAIIQNLKKTELFVQAHRYQSAFLPMLVALPKWNVDIVAGYLGGDLTAKYLKVLEVRTFDDWLLMILDMTESDYLPLHGLDITRGTYVCVWVLEAYINLCHTAHHSLYDAYLKACVDNLRRTPKK